MLALCIAAHAFSAPTVPVTHMARSSPVQMKAVEMPSRRAAVLSAASLLMVPLAVQAAPEDYVGGYTEKMFEKDAYSKTKPKCFSSGAAAPDACENPGGSKNDPRINPWAGNKAAAAPVQVAAAPAEPKKE